MKIKKLSNDQDKNTILILQGWEAEQARPNSDPFSNMLRRFEETGQFYTSSEHIKHHIRRGLATEAKQLKFYKEHQPITEDALIYYKKENEDGNIRCATSRQTKFKNVYSVEPSDIPTVAVDTAIFGYVAAAQKGDNCKLVAAARTIFLPTTFHQCKLLHMGINNAFGQKDGQAAGSNMREILIYGHYLALWEINLTQLDINTKNHKACLNHEEWIELFLNGFWTAYSKNRYGSMTQGSQFASFQIIWQPDSNNLRPTNPANIAGNNIQEIADSITAKEFLLQNLPPYLTKLGYNKDTHLGSQGEIANTIANS